MENIEEKIYKIVDPEYSIEPTYIASDKSYDEIVHETSVDKGSTIDKGISPSEKNDDDNCSHKHFLYQ